MIDISPHVEQMIITRAEQRGVSVDALLLQTFAQDDEQAYYDWFYEHHYDIDKLDKAINSGVTEPIPPHALESVESLEKWLSGAKTA
ncbi:hypothetical protein LP117_03090 [Moraxella bovis]|uniref:hypothetical protein n=1 Tax=Moraxella bovis TaxID=476 RepID=UPI0022280284|nr:hypothetical protein [Moraxella bovis]UZA25463.1 hypothetical protein LP117_03090 [Moraxella bovis]UZA29043.1 hypothetical protein LP097_08755 [Moraxella bovis]